MSEQREGFKQLGEHREDCLAVGRGDGEPFVITDRLHPFDFSRHKDGRRVGSTMWWQFVCNDTACEAKLLVRWDRMAQFVNGTDQRRRVVVNDAIND